MRRLAVLAVAIAASALALPASAVADVYVAVPAGFLGGPIWTPVPVLSPDVAGRPSLAPRMPADDCRGADPGDCVVVGPDAQTDAVPLPAPGPAGVGTPGDGTGVEQDPPPAEDTPEDPEGEGQAAQARPAVPAVAPPPEALTQALGGLTHPRAADWLAWQRPTLRWRARAGAAYYNVQIFRGARRVLSAWSSATRLRVPEGVLEQGRSYVWVVWPGSGPRGAARYGTPVGRSTFAVTLRPRIVFHGRGRGRTVAEVRPHIPGGRIRLVRPRGLARVPAVVTVDRRGRFSLPISARTAERLGAALVGRGPSPPVGLRGPGL